MKPTKPDMKLTGTLKVDAVEGTLSLEMRNEFSADSPCPSNERAAKNAQTLCLGAISQIAKTVCEKTGMPAHVFAMEAVEAILSNSGTLGIDNDESGVQTRQLPQTASLN